MIRIFSSIHFDSFDKLRNLLSFKNCQRLAWAGSTARESALTLTLTLTLTFHFPLFTHSTISGRAFSQVWSPDNGDGTYTNPIVMADYSDPDPICVGEDYYLTASSFNCMPGLPILHSRDLVNWNIIGHALTRQFPDSLTTQHGRGVWAPSLRYHDNRFYIYWGDPDQGVFMVSTADPAGKWDDPVLVMKARGVIDTCPLWDDNGRCYLIHAYANSRAHVNSLLTVVELSADGRSVIGLPHIVFDGGGTANHTCEGPKFYKRDGWYWILCPAGGVERGFQLAMRSKHIYGPYEWKVVLSQGTTKVNGPHQGGWIHTAFGEDWFIHFQDCGAIGRVLHLQPVDWSSGWPMMGNNGAPVIRHKKPKSSSTAVRSPATSDEFNDSQLGLQWQWHGDYQPLFGMPMANGCFRLFTATPSRPSIWDTPSLLLQKIPSERFTATAKVRMSAKAVGQYGGIVMMGMDYEALVVELCAGNQFQLKLIDCSKADKGGQETSTIIVTVPMTCRDSIDYHAASHLDIYLRMTVRERRCQMSYSLDNRQFRKAGEGFTYREGKWIGAKMGFVCMSPLSPSTDLGYMDIDWWRVEE